MKYVAICQGTSDTIWASGNTEKSAKSLLWKKVHDYLVARNAPETSEYSSEELENYFGYWLIDTDEREGQYGI